MAGGIVWFRWHHGSVTDPKFKLVANKTGASLPDVLAVWAYLLETASASADRGRIGEVDCETWDCLFSFADGRTAAILAAMEQRSLIQAGSIVSWEKRQPKREREDDASAERVKAFRERQRHETPSNANASTETPREDKSREEKKEDISSLRSEKPRKRGGFDAAGIELPEWLDRELWQRWCLDRKGRGKVVTEDGARLQVRKLDEYRNAGHPPRAVIEHAIASGHQGLYPPPAVNGSVTQHNGETAWQRSQRERVHDLTGGLASAKPPGRLTEPMEIFDVAAKRLG